MKRTYSTEDTEPNESNFKIPSEKEHLLQVTDVNPVVEPGGENPNIQLVKLEIVGGDEEGRTLLTRINLNQELKSFYFTRLFLKAIGEPYKGQFELDIDHWCGRQFYATIKHSFGKDGVKIYANINEYNFNKVVEQYKPPIQTAENSEEKKDEIVW